MDYDSEEQVKNCRLNMGKRKRLRPRSGDGSLLSQQPSTPGLPFVNETKEVATADSAFIE